MFVAFWDWLWKEGTIRHRGVNRTPSKRNSTNDAATDLTGRQGSSSESHYE